MTIPMDRIASLERRVSEIEKRFKAPEQTQAEFFVHLIGARLKMYGARLDVDRAISRIRKQVSAEWLIRIFSKGAPVR